MNDIPPVTGLRRHLPQSMMAPTDLPAGDIAALPEGRLAALWKAGVGSHKWLHYFDVYEKELGPLVGNRARILEIGVARGGSLTLWKDYLGGGSTVVGIDIDPACAAFDAADRGIHVRIGSQTDANFLAQMVAEFGPFDAIIDDGSHCRSHILSAFGSLFGDGLKPGGVYVIEDTHASYWGVPFDDIDYSIADFGRDLIDLLHAPYWSVRSLPAFSHGHEGRLAAVTVPALATLLQSVALSDSMMVLRRRTGQPTMAIVARNDDIAVPGRGLLGRIRDRLFAGRHRP